MPKSNTATRSKGPLLIFKLACRKPRCGGGGGCCRQSWDVGYCICDGFEYNSGYDTPDGFRDDTEWGSDDQWDDNTFCYGFG